MTDLMMAPLSSTIPNDVRVMVERVLEHTKQVEETNWSLATQGEAQLMLGDLDQAQRLYSCAISITNSPREIDSIYSQAIRVAVRTSGQEGANLIEHLFDLPGNKPTDQERRDNTTQQEQTDIGRWNPAPE